MLRHPLTALSMAAVAAPLAAQAPRPSPAAVSPARQVERATLLWDAGDYPAALEGMAQLLRTAQPDEVLKPLALLTGEWYTTSPMAENGRNVRISADGRFGAWETGPTSAPIVTVVRLADGARVAELPGRSLAFAPDGHAAAFVDPNGPRVMILDLTAETASPLATPPLWQPVVAWGSDSRSLWLVAAQAGDSGNAIVHLGLDGRSRSFATPGEAATDPIAVPGGLWLVHMVGNNTIAVRGIVTGSNRRFAGRGVQISTDGSALVAMTVEPGKNRVWVLPLEQEDADPVIVLDTPLRVENPAISADGKRVVFSMMYEDDWELAVAEVGGSVRRLSREIQHDRVPRFLTADRILAVMGEGRHRRSHLYDFTTGERARLFHNNTVRTIAPEYEWAASADGSTLLIVADRDGDTVSPERGVTLMDLNQPVSQDELLARVEGNLAGERALRTIAASLFRPIAPLVGRLTDSVSTTRLYGYQLALAQFDSRHITQPGNTPAGVWLAETLLSFGYAPEYQWFQPPALRASGGQTANVFATLLGTTHPDVVYVLGSHYDSVNQGPGADDNASGTAVLLETARILAGHPLPATVIFAAFTGEEGGLLGAREFARRAVADSVDVRGALNNDMFGWSNDHRLDNTIRYSNPGIRDVQHAAALGFSELITYDSRYYQSTDADPMFQAWGNVIGGMGSYPVLGNPHYHQRTDRLNTINQTLVAETARANVAALVYLASSPSPVRGLAIRRQAGGGVVTWEAGPEKDIASYTVTWGPSNEPARGTATVRGTTATIGVLPEGIVVSVRAVNGRGLVGWDWSRIAAPPVVEE
ncbi:MAG: M20/M25/M40 family metallo-hydrolase [Gemmatimonadota bacterium]|nr:M20/M25/M40 family metallo-hydrolase [Gemmatimonadota bacterium]